MATQTIDKALFEAYFDQLLVEKRSYFKELLTEIIDERKTNVNDKNIFLDSLDIRESEEERVLKNIENIMSKHDNLLKRLAQ
jgi:hypothetical protein